MQRSPHLEPLSHDHFEGLLVVKRIGEGLAGSIFGFGGARVCAGKPRLRLPRPSVEHERIIARLHGAIVHHGLHRKRPGPLRRDRHDRLCADGGEPLAAHSFWHHGRMSVIYLIRHGQASFGTANYDRGVCTGAAILRKGR